jgi:hypothetical protein
MKQREKKTDPVATALVEGGVAWAPPGLDAGDLSLEDGARALTRAVRAVETVAREVQKKRQTPRR